MKRSRSRGGRKALAIFLSILFVLMAMGPALAADSLSIVESGDEAILAAERARQELRDLGRRLHLDFGASDYQPQGTVEAQAEEEIGTVKEFWVHDFSTNQSYKILATLQAKSEHAYFYVQEGNWAPLGDEIDPALVTPAEAEQALEAFEKIYATDRYYFGEEPNPSLAGNSPNPYFQKLGTGDIDGDSHITILNFQMVPPVQYLGQAYVAGYFSPGDEYLQEDYPYSNEREMFYMNTLMLTPGTEDYNSTLAHEFQHMIHYNWDPDEDTWVNEGLSDMAMEVNGFPVGSHVTAFEQYHDNQLNAWDGETGSEVLADYGAAYLWMSYFFEHYSRPDDIRRLVAEDANGFLAFDRELARLGYGVTSKDLFKDWVIANYLDSTTIPKWGYSNVDLHVQLDDSFDAFPASGAATVDQYAADYYRIQSAGGTVGFQGGDQFRLISNLPHSGTTEIWGNRINQTDATATFNVDLTGKSSAELSFWTWYDIETDWDYAYVQVSTDGGSSWTNLRLSESSDTNPNGNNRGNGITGKSGVDSATEQAELLLGTLSTPQWVQETLDLSAYVGQPVQIRFLYATDPAVLHEGFTVDDVRVMADGQVVFEDDFEDPRTWETLWSHHTFLRTDGYIAEVDAVQLLVLGSTPEVIRPGMNGTATTVELPAGEVIFIPSGMTDDVRQSTAYQYEVDAVPGGPTSGETVIKREEFSDTALPSVLYTDRELNYSKKYDITVEPEVTQLKLALTWDSSDDLDLFLYDAQGNLVKAGQSSDAGQETLTVSAPAAGPYTVEVAGYINVAAFFTLVAEQYGLANQAPETGLTVSPETITPDSRTVAIHAQVRDREGAADLTEVTLVVRDGKGRFLGAWKKSDFGQEADGSLSLLTSVKLTGRAPWTVTLTARDSYDHVTTSTHQVEIQR